MRNRLARACSALAAGVALTSMVGLSAAGPADARVAPAAPPACGFSCFNLSSLALGRGSIQSVYGAGRFGQLLNLSPAVSTPDQDFEGAQVGTLLNYCPNYGGTGFSATSYVCISYPPGYPVYESNWAPFGNQSGLCDGAFAPVYSGEPVSLQYCGTSATSLWVGDLARAVIRSGHVYFPWVNGGSTTFSHVLVLNVNTLTRRPADQLQLQTLNTLAGGIVPASQQFTFTLGPV
jgi:hypothetical protein